MKVIIIGSSIAGASAAYLLAGHAEVYVYEKRSRKEVSEKVCANICTAKIKELTNSFGIKFSSLIKSKYTKLKIFSKKNSASFSTEEYEIDRNKLLGELIKKAHESGAHFSYNTEFVDVDLSKANVQLKLKRGERIFNDEADILIGADGALSHVAKKAGIWPEEEKFLYIQTRLKKSAIKNKLALPKKNTYHVFKRNDLGYYAYIFPSGNSYILGSGDYIKDARTGFEFFMKFCGVDINKCKVEGALIPIPRKINPKKNVYLLGDAGGNVKFTGGGIIPAMLSALALKEILVNNDNSLKKKLDFNMSFNRFAAKFFKNLSDNQIEKVVALVKHPKYKDLLSKRDELSVKMLKKGFDARLIPIFLKTLV